MKQRIFTTFLLFIFALCPLTSQATAPSTWVVNPDKITSFAGAQQKYLEEALSHYKIKVTYDKSLNVDSSDPVPVRPQSLTPLVVEKNVSVHLITPSLEELHVGLMVKDLSALKGEALRDFNRMLQNVVQTFQDLGYGDYLAFCDFGKKYAASSGPLMKGNCWEMIPLGKGHVTSKDGVYQFAPKIWRGNYVLFNQTPNFKKTNPDIVSRFTRILHSRLAHKTPHSPSFCQETLPWMISIPDLGESKQASLKRVLLGLQNLGAVRILTSSATVTSPGVAGKEADNSTEEFTPAKKKDRAGCVFCKEEILKKQEMVSTGKTTILYNHQAYSKNAHFMILPFDHQESLHCVPDDQFDEMIQEAQKLNLALGDTKNIVWFCQNGLHAGQTVPHTHMHVLHRPNPLNLSVKILNELAGHQDKPVGPEDYEAAQKALLERFKILGLDKTGS